MTPAEQLRLQKEFNQLDAWHETALVFHDGWFFCTCKAAARMRELRDLLNPRPLPRHRLEVTD